MCPIPVLLIPRVQASYARVKALLGANSSKLKLLAMALLEHEVPLPASPSSPLLLLFDTMLAADPPFMHSMHLMCADPVC